jgi:hypothetical protein
MASGLAGNLEIVHCAKDVLIDGFIPDSKKMIDVAYERMVFW